MRSRDRAMKERAAEIRFRYKVRGEKWGFQRVDVMRQFPMPVVEGYTGYIPEDIVWRAIARHYRTRYVNERLRVYWQDQKDGLSGSRFASRAVGGLLEAGSMLDDDLRWFPHDPIEFLRKGAKYSRCSFHLGRSLRAQVRGLRRREARLLWAITLPVGWLYYLADLRDRSTASAAIVRPEDGRAD